MINGKSYYQVLGVLDDAEDIVIRAAYKSLAAKYHPDKWSGDKQFANSRMSEINIAHDCLSNLDKRRIYDEDLKSSSTWGESKKVEDEEQFNAYSHHDPTVFRGSGKQSPSGRSKLFIFGAIFIALIFLLTFIIERNWRPFYS